MKPALSGGKAKPSLKGLGNFASHQQRLFSSTFQQKNITLESHQTTSIKFFFFYYFMSCFYFMFDGLVSIIWPLNCVSWIIGKLLTSSFFGH